MRPARLVNRSLIRAHVLSLVIMRALHSLSTRTRTNVTSLILSSQFHSVSCCIPVRWREASWQDDTGSGPHGDVVVWGGLARMYYHGVMPLRSGGHPSVGLYRYNLTFRRAG
jgi:hypothetical protein